VQGKTAKYLVFSSDFVTNGAPFYKWCRFTYGAVTIDIIDMPNGVCMTVLHRTAVVTKHQFTGSKLLQIYVRALNFSSVHT